jgi:hypothetical protein
VVCWCAAWAYGIRPFVLVLYVVYMRGPGSTSNGTPEEPPKQSTVLLLLGTIADTTWRMFIPIIGLLMLGVWVDKTYDSLPWATISLTILGIVIAAELVRRQLNIVNKK